MLLTKSPKWFTKKKKIHKNISPVTLALIMTMEKDSIIHKETGTKINNTMSMKMSKGFLISKIKIRINVISKNLI
jgi:hypothetical protein